MSKLPDDLKLTVSPSEGMLRFVESFNAATADFSIGAPDDLQAAGVRLRSVMENVDETSAGKLMRNIYGAF